RARCPTYSRSSAPRPASRARLNSRRGAGAVERGGLESTGTLWSPVSPLLSGGNSSRGGPRRAKPGSGGDNEARRGAGAVERGGLENRWRPKGRPWVQIPPPPLG